MYYHSRCSEIRLCSSGGQIFMDVIQHEKQQWLEISCVLYHHGESFVWRQSLQSNVCFATDTNSWPVFFRPCSHLWTKTEDERMTPVSWCERNNHWCSAFGLQEYSTSCIWEFTALNQLVETHMNTVKPTLKTCKLTDLLLLMQENGNAQKKNLKDVFEILETLIVHYDP
jgi:hypothetical protein